MSYLLCYQQTVRQVQKVCPEEPNKPCDNVWVEEFHTTCLPLNIYSFKDAMKKLTALIAGKSQK